MELGLDMIQKMGEAPGTFQQPPPFDN
jgi:hypothetical protein